MTCAAATAMPSKTAERTEEFVDQGGKGATEVLRRADKKPETRRIGPPWLLTCGSRRGITAVDPRRPKELTDCEPCKKGAKGDAGEDEDRSGEEVHSGLCMTRLSARRAGRISGFA